MIITISHQMGTGGPEIGMALAKRLGYRYVDQELISDAARRYGLLEEKLSHLDESKASLFERFDVPSNTEKLSHDAAAEVIEGLARRPEFQTMDTGRQIVASRALASKVQVALATHPETRKYRIAVEAKDGVVTLEGTAALDSAVEVARTVPGVRLVKTQQVE